MDDTGERRWGDEAMREPEPGERPYPLTPPDGPPDGPHRQIMDCTSGEVRLVALTDEEHAELAQMQARVARESESRDAARAGAHAALCDRATQEPAFAALCQLLGIGDPAATDSTRGGRG